jgi:dinuclear metal center YbgI/SA1388 family protein
MRISNLLSVLHSFAPPDLAESYDNPGLLVGDPQTEVTGILINLDMTEAVIREAHQRGCNVVVAHHPILFTALKKLSGSDYVSRALRLAIKLDVALIAVHTNLDNVRQGVNHRMAQQLGLVNTRILSPKPATLRKLEVYVPVEHRVALLQALWKAGAGQIGNYGEASFSSEGQGTFLPLEGANPAIGGVGQHETVLESRIEVVFPAHLKGAVLAAMRAAHPYEEVAHQVIATENSIADIGAGLVGDLPSPLGKRAFLEKVRQAFGCGGIRYADAPLDEVSRVALCGGSGSFLTSAALRAGAQAFVTADVTYHKFFDNEDRMLLLDVGHHESEQYTSALISDVLLKSFPNFAVHLSETLTNPVKYF